MINSDSKGFTLIELLVVVAILGLLATIVAVSLTGARGRARDGRRSSDLRQMELALELYYSAERQYPSNMGLLVQEDYLNMATVPEDPATGERYCYTYGEDPEVEDSRDIQYYHLGAKLENTESDLLEQDKDFNSATDTVANWKVGSKGDCAGDIWSGSEGGFDGTANPIYDRAITP